MATVLMRLLSGRLLPGAAVGHCAAFSTTTAALGRKTRDRSRRRGVSSLYRSGPRQALSVSGEAIPQPRQFAPRAGDRLPVAPSSLGEKRAARYRDRHPPRAWPSTYYPPADTAPDHGLWAFFPAYNVLLRSPKEESAHGRSWAVAELRRKSWDDLHRLWWVCVRERNVLATARCEFRRAQIGFIGNEHSERDHTVRKTMTAIKATLTERFYLWEDARALARSDPEIDLSRETDVYRPLQDLTEEQYTDVANAVVKQEAVRLKKP